MTQLSVDAAKEVVDKIAKGITERLVQYLENGGSDGKPIIQVLDRERFLAVVNVWIATTITTTMDKTVSHLVKAVVHAGTSSEGSREASGNQ